MAVTFSAAGASGNINTQTGSPKSVPWSHTAAAGDAVLAFFNACTNGGGDITASSCLYGATPMTLLGYIAANNQPYNRLLAYGLFNAPAGAATITASATAGSGDVTCIDGQSLSYAGVSGFGTPVTGAGVATAPAVNVTNVANGMVVAGISQPANGATVMTSPSQTQRYNHAPLVTNTDTTMLLQDSNASGSVYLGATAAFGSWIGAIGIPLLPAAGVLPNQFFMAS